MSLATAEAIRDRVYTLIEALTPTSLSSDKFRRYRNEADADFTEWSEANAAAALRRFQVRETGDDEPPLTSAVTEERVRLRLQVQIAYPQTHRYGSANAGHAPMSNPQQADWAAFPGRRRASPARRWSRYPPAGRQAAPRRPTHKG